jgi:DNA primase
MRFPEAFLNEVKSRVRLSDVVGRKVKLKKQGRDHVGLSPFSNEKTPSFHVHDDKGFYKCFSTQKGGDVFTFLMETERLTFAEAVEKLALEAGLQLPSQSPAEQAAYKRQTTLKDWTERACQFFEAQLLKPAGAEARAYLERRGFGPEAWRRHRIGFAPDGWRTLSDHLTKQGASVPELVEAGLLVEPEDAGQGGGKQPWDRFRNRVIFPIADPQGRVVAFGARTLDPDGKPKYLNSSDGPLFHKGRTLYRYKAAREALAELKDGPLSRGLIVTEGYVDAIALAEAGVETAVAPLGTALTEEQLQMLWRAGPEPILCFDGDAAGLRAAWKAVDRALPDIEPGRSLFFVLLPDGLDPDDMIRLRGPDAMRAALDGAKPLVDVLWRRELEAGPADTPERKADLEKRLLDAAARIRHAGVRRAYERELKDRLYWHFRNLARPPGREPSNVGPLRKLPRLPQLDHLNVAKIQGLRLVVRAIENSHLIEAAQESLAQAEFQDSDVEAIRNAAFDVLDASGRLDREIVAAHLRSLGRDRAVDLLERCGKEPPIDLASAEATDWFDALRRFPAAQAHLRGVQVDPEVAAVTRLTAEIEARLKATALERMRVTRSMSDQTAAASAGDQGASKLREALGQMDAAVAARLPGN